jgi:hypothetical protein
MLVANAAGAAKWRLNYRFKVETLLQNICERSATETEATSSFLVR